MLIYLLVYVYMRDVDSTEIAIYLLPLFRSFQNNAIKYKRIHENNGVRLCYVNKYRISKQFYLRLCDDYFYLKITSYELNSFSWQDSNQTAYFYS